MVAGAPLPGRDVGWAALALGLAILGRAGIALFLRYPIWPSFTHPFMAAAWGAITLRSLGWRFLRRELVWRGRKFPATLARF